MGRKLVWFSYKTNKKVIKKDFAIGDKIATLGGKKPKPTKQTNQNQTNLKTNAQNPQMPCLLILIPVFGFQST